MRAPGKAALVSAALGIVVLVSGCTATADPSVDPTPPPSESVQPKMSGEGLPHPSPTWDAEARAAAVTAADAGLRAYVQKLPRDEWYSALSEHLDPGAREAYRTVDPANIAVTVVRGTGTITDDTTPFLATVQFNTDAGDVRVLVRREAPDAPWLVVRFELPKGR